MSKNIRVLNEPGTENQFYPQTHEKAVIDGNGNTLDVKIAGKQDTIEDLTTIRSGAASGATAYQKPGTGIPSTDMSSGVNTSLSKADSAYQKPSGGIPKTDMTSAVQGSLDLADSAVQCRPSGEIDPTITPAEYATQEELTQLEAEIGDTSPLDTQGYVQLTPTIVQDYYWYIPNAAPVSANGYSYTRIPCSPGDKFLVTGFSPNSNIPLATAFNENVSPGGQQELVYGGNQQQDVEVTIPAGPYNELIVNGHTLQPIAVKKYETITGNIMDYVTGIDAEVGDGDVSAITGEKTQTGTKTSGKYIKLDLTEVASADYEFVELPVSPSEKYYIEGWNLNSNIPLSLFAKSGTSDTLRGLYDGTSKGMNGVVTVPTGYDTLYVNGNNAQGVPVVIRKQVTADDLTNAVGLLNDADGNIKDALCPIYIKMNDLASIGDYNGMEIYIIKRFNQTNDLFWNFQNKMGNPNKFFDFRAVGLVPRGTARIQDFICISNKTELVGSTSDYILPLVVGATTNKDGDFPDNTSYFTGGAHGYGNSSSSSVTATMREVSRSILLDGIPVVGGDRKYGNVLQIDVINNIQGCNTEKSNGTGREIIQEHIRVFIDRENVNVEVSFTALEEVNIYALYGLGQYFDFANVRFIGSTTKRGVYVAGQRTVTEDKHTNTIRCYGTDYYFDISMDRSFGLAQDGGLAEYNAMGTIANKGYFNLVGETPLTLQSGEMVSFRGSFAFGKIPALS